MISQKETLIVKNLSTHFYTKNGVLKAVDSVSFKVQRGNILGLVGESGSGKTVTGLSIMGLIESPGKIVDGQVLFGGENLINVSKERLRQLRGFKIAMIFQDAMMTLNPVLRIDTQMVEALNAHRVFNRKIAYERARNALEQVGMPAAEERLKSYPHQFSGGMRQRVVIATSILNKPELIIADEPTTALDVTIQAQILYEIKKLCKERGTTLIWITHDLSVIAAIADDVCVMYAGNIVEQGSIDEVLDHPLHPYTIGLLNSIPKHNRRGKPLEQIPGMAPSLINLPEGCSFRPRCNFATDLCLKKPDVFIPGPGRKVRCFHPNVAS